MQDGIVGNSPAAEPGGPASPGAGKVASWRLNGSLVFVDPGCDDRTWSCALEHSILERFAMDNASWIARRVDRATFDKFPRSAHFEVYHGAVTRIERLPRHDYYKRGLVVMSENHYLLTRYGYEQLRAEPAADARALLAGRVNVYNDVHNLAVRAVDEAFDRCRGIWAARCADALDRFGDVYGEVFGESEPYYGEAGDPWNDGDLL